MSRTGCVVKATGATSALRGSYHAIDTDRLWISAGIRAGVGLLEPEGLWTHEGCLKIATKAKIARRYNSHNGCLND